MNILEIVWNIKGATSCRYGDLEAVQDFLAIGKDVNEADADGRSPLHYAVAYSQGEVMEELLSSGANLEARVSP